MVTKPSWKPQVKKPEHQQHVGAMAQRLAERLPVGLGVGGAGGGFAGRRRLGARGRDREGERDDEQQHARENLKRTLPAEIVDQAHAERREQELPERTRRGAGAERGRTPVRRQKLAERRDDHVERAAGDADTDQHAGGEIEHPGRRGVRHHEQAEGVEQRADDDDAGGAETIGESAGERLRRAGNQGLHGGREREHLAAPTVRVGERREKEAERRARPEADHGDQAAAGDDDGRGAPVSARREPCR